MKKLILPKVKIDDAPEKMSQKEFEAALEEHHSHFVPDAYFDVGDLYITCSIDADDEGYYLYAYIYHGPNYCDYALVMTDDFHFHTYAQWKRAIKTLKKQLISRWKDWVKGLYEEE